MKRSIILAALILSMAVTVFAEEELIWEEQAATEDVAYAFEEEKTPLQYLLSSGSASCCKRSCFAVLPFSGYANKM